MRKFSQQKQDEIYIESYLNPKRKWYREVPPKQRIDLIRYANVNWTVISDYIRDMDYRDFLATPYWKAIAAHTRYKAGYRCQLCNSGSYLTTHHRNYDVHGWEHAHMHELIVLCNYCHEKFHDIEEKAVQSDNIRPIVVGLILFVIACLIIGNG